jgi:hypothetical protein
MSDDSKIPEREKITPSAEFPSLSSISVMIHPRRKGNALSIIFCSHKYR